MGHKKLEELKENASYKDISNAKKDLLDVFLGEIHTKGAANIDTMEAGQVVDMIKDLAEAEKYCMEASYYETVIKAMEEAGEEDENEMRMGYNNRRYANGRYAPKGAGRRMGYIPEMMMYPYMYEEDYDFPEMRFGYQGEGGGRSQGGNRGGSGRSSYQNSGAGNRSQSGSRMGYDDGYDWDPDDDPRQSKEYNEYKRAKRHYKETKSPEEKQKMDEHAMKHMNQTLDSFREMWRDADPNMRKRMKADLTALIGEMPT